MSRQDTSIIPPRHAIGSRIDKVSHGPAALFQAAIANHYAGSGPSPTDRPSSVATYVAKVTIDYLNRTLTRADLSRHLGERRRETHGTNSQYSLDFGHKMFDSSE